MSEVSEGWNAWIRRGLESGRSPFSLLNEMRAAGMAPVPSQQAVAQVFHAFLSGLTLEQLAATQYQYGKSWLPAGNQLQLCDKPVTVAFRMMQPDIAVIDDFLSPQECEALICQSVDRLAPSTVADLDQGTRQPHAARTSSGMYFALGENPLLVTIERRLASLVGVPVSHGEGIQVLHYLVGKEYQPHFDYFPEQHAGSQAFLAGGGQRMVTLIMYLNDVEAGGETVFPNIGLQVVPRKGSLLYFSYANTQGQLDQSTLHGGSPVIRGEKWIATKWLRQQPRVHNP